MLISARMLEIVKHLYQYKTTTYKEIEQSLGIKERNVRYDVDRINEILAENGLEQIERKGKGVLEVPANFKTYIFETNNEFVYSQAERSSILLLYLFFNNKELKLNKIAKKIQVSRSTIKNDFDEIEQMLLRKGFEIKYDDNFIINGDTRHCIHFMVGEIKKYISLIKHSKYLNSFQEYVLEILEQSFKGVSLSKIITSIDDMLEETNRTFTDETYNWYVANILCMIWLFEKDGIPAFDLGFLERDDQNIDKFIFQLETLLNKEIDKKNRNKMINFLSYLNLYAKSENSLDMVNVEAIVTNFISGMSLEMGIPFQNDPILIEGLFNHIVPLIQRIKLGVVVDENVISLLSTKNLEVYEIVSRVITKIDILNKITNENEIAYLTIHFIASLKRINTTNRKKVLLVCGHGYGTTTMLKETLLTEYQVEIVDTIPKYKISSYQNFDNIDLVITTTKLDVGIDYLKVNPILTELDDRCLINAGIARRTPLSNYYSINKSLDFLTDEDRLRVLDVIREELGYRDLCKPKKIAKLSDLLSENAIKIVDEEMTWEEAIIQSCNIMENINAINRNYMESIFDIIEQNGFYSIIDGSFALLHGNCDIGVYKTSMSMIINKKKIKFGEKEVNIIFCLSSKDQKEHIPAIINLMKLEKTTDFIKYVLKADSSKEAHETLVQYERRII